MKLTFTLLMAVILPSGSAFAAWKQVWETKVPGRPLAAFFHAADGKIFVATQTEKKSAVWAVSDAGTLSEDAIIEEKGNAGPLRAGGGRLYWAVGGKVISFTPEGGKKKEEGKFTDEILDLTVDPKGQVYLAGAKGLLLGEKVIQPKAVHGLLFLAMDLYTLNEGKVVATRNSSSPLTVCAAGCKWLERSPDGSWITVRGNQVVAVGKKETVLAEGKGLGKPAYVYRRESKDDLLIVPYPEEGMVRAFRAP